MILAITLAVLIIGFIIYLKRKPKKSTVNYVLMVKTLTDDEKAFEVLLNTHREKNALKPLKCDLEASRVIGLHVDWMLINGIKHDRFADRLGYLMNKGVKSAGEILAYKHRSPKTAFSAFLNSETHKKQINVGSWDAFGISIKTDSSGKKYYGILFIEI